MLCHNLSIDSIMWCEKDGQITGVVCDWDPAEDHHNGYRLSIRPPDEVAAAGPPVSVDTSKGTGHSWRQLMSKIKTRFNLNVKQEVTASSSQRAPKPRYRTGAEPFMAMDLLRSDPPPVYKYRHDLESFFYIYAYAAAAYDPVKKKFGYIAQWQHSSLVAIADSKRKFLTNGTEITAVFSKAHEDFKPLLEPGALLMQLLHTFRALECHMDTIEDIMTSIVLLGQTDDVTAEVEKIERMRDQVVTYSTFMRILGAQEDV
ncbi:uncharacterized protein B0H18DRAFT_1211495 [Fomitopsis serialis]|uniref:uncharacterized protein n=1 Tax=Fomitopsis serialis TaxID=139415 RepID=UPI002008328B|nr:uncharacterized protein B0H18DRAFT_1211495 [Neoantrodia serialis]KAH9925290.1 hypothetical protein B0H18DRAFT_1211495 [Neoantrodia serialis]